MFGVLNINKPPDVTSRDVVNVVQRLIRPVKVGHAGTLDPMATGVLLLCVGKGTKLISLLQESPKTYEAEFTLGQRSDTDDSTGEVQHLGPFESVPTESQIRDALQTFVGTTHQTPPAFSAVKIQGQRAYAKARRGEEVVLSSRPVTVHQIELLSYKWPKLTVRIHCGSGTYIRSIARDLGQLLNVGGLMSALERTAIGAFHVRDAISPDNMTLQAVTDAIVNPVQVVDRFLQYRCSKPDVERLAAGRSLEVNASQMSTPQSISNQQPLQVAFLTEHGETLLALGEVDLPRGLLQPRIVLM